MRYFIEEDELKFYKEPNSFNKYSDKNILKYAVGANLYIKLKFWRIITIFKLLIQITNVL